MSMRSRETAQYSSQDLQRSREKIQLALDEARERANKTHDLDDEIESKFNKLQLNTIQLVDILKSIGCDQQPDWIHLFDRVCNMMQPLKGSLPFMSASTENEIRTEDLLSRQQALMELTRIMGRKLLFEGKHNQAVPAAIQCLRFSIDVHGLNSVNLVPAYLILGEASIGMGKLSQADEYLAQAEWTVVKSHDSTDKIKSKLYRNIGLLHAAKGDYDNALRLFAEDIFHASVEWGTNDIHTSGGYFHMANVFFRQNKMEVADSLYCQVSENWFNFLLEAVKTKTKSPSATSFLGRAEKEGAGDAPLLDEEQEAEAVQMLNAVYDIREQSTKSNFPQLASICHALSMLYYLLGDFNRSQDFSAKADAARSQFTTTDTETELSIGIPNYLQAA